MNELPVTRPAEFPAGWPKHCNMNLETLFPLWFFLCIAAGSAVAHYTSTPIINGAGIGMIVGVAPIVGLTMLGVLIPWWRPDLPRCRCGKTKYGEYESIGSMLDPLTHEWCYENQCPKCGRHYKSKSNVVYEVMPDGTMTPYMKTSRWGRWIIASDST